MHMIYALCSHRRRCIETFYDGINYVSHESGRRHVIRVLFLVFWKLGPSSSHVFRDLFINDIIIITYTNHSTSSGFLLPCVVRAISRPKKKRLFLHIIFMYDIFFFITSRIIIRATRAHILFVLFDPHKIYQFAVIVIEMVIGIFYERLNDHFF